jgi:hypothetical protein
MAKKAKRSAPVQEVSPGANPYDNRGISGRRLGMIMGSICLLVFIYFEQLWIGTLSCALAFLVLYVMQVFFEKSKAWYESIYLYATILALALAYGEFSTGFISNLLTF